MKSKQVVVVGIVALAVAAVAAVTVSSKLFVNGKVASTDVRVINGKAYAPLADVAKSLDMTLVAKAGGYELTKSGGAGQIANKNVGKLGEEIFTGKYRFTVVSFEQVEKYRKMYTTASYEKDYESDENNILVIVKCRVKNGTKVKDELVFGEWDGNNTAITTTDEESITPTAYDVKETEFSPRGATFLPGAAINFNLIFKVPRGSSVKDLIFTALQYEFRSKYEQNKVKPTDIRVSLSK